MESMGWGLSNFYLRYLGMASVMVPYLLWLFFSSSSRLMGPLLGEDVSTTHFRVTFPNDYPTISSEGSISYNHH